MRTCFVLIAFCVTSLVPFPPTAAQTTTGTIRGYVRDQNARPLANAQIEARNIATGVARTATSDADGSYILPGLVPATYDLVVRRVANASQRRQVVVRIGATLLADFTLQAGAVELEAVTIEAATPMVELRTSEVAVNVTPQQIEQLPTVNRNFLDLATLAPGVVVSEDRLSTVGRRAFSGGGASPNQSNVFVDGSSLKNDVSGGGVSGQDNSRGNPFPRNAIQEYRVITQNFKAEYQKASSAIITATTKSGSNRWSGNALFTYQSKGLVALDTFQTIQKNTNPNFKEPDFTRYIAGLSVGGPLIRDRLFFFGSYEGNYQDRSEIINISPVTGFTGIDTVNLTQYNGNFTSPFRETLVFGKLTYAISENSSADLSFNTRHETDIRDFEGARTFSAATNFRQDVSIGQLRYNRYWGAWLNEAKVDYSRFRRNPSPNTRGVAARLYHYLIPGTVTRQDAWIGSDLSEQDFIQKRIGFRNDLTYSGREQHVIKGGVSVDLLTYDISKLNDVTPKFDYAQYVNPVEHDFTPSPTGVPYNFRNPYRLVFAVGAGNVNRKNTQIGAYLQDDWTPTPRLTFNLGIRWDFESRMINTDYVTPRMVVDTLTRYNSSLPTPLDLGRYISTGDNRKPFYGAFQPRLGFSYGLDKENRTTVFGGFGIYYDRSIFDFSIDEIQKIDRPTYFVRFAHPDSTPTAGQVRWNDSYLTADTSVLSTLARTSGQPEAFLLDNEMKPPKSTQWSLGVRRVLGSWVASLTYQGQRGTDLFTYNWANIALDPATRRCCVSFDLGAHGFRNFIYSTNDGKTWYDALSFQLDRPYRRSPDGIGWGGGLLYTFADRDLAGVDNLDDITGSFPGGFPNARSIPKRTDCCGADERHRVVANWIMDLPYLRGIQFSGLITLGSGGVRDVGTHPRFGGVPDTSFFINALAPPRQSFFVFGAWAYRRVDVRLRKDFPQISGTTLGVTVDVFNVFNYSNLGNYDFAVDAGGQRWSTIQKVARADQVVSDPRRVQIGVEYSF
jgi:hypothetical protein